MALRIIAVRGDIDLNVEVGKHALNIVFRHQGPFGCNAFFT